MKKMIAMLGFAFFALASSAHAHESPAWVCGLKMKGQARGVQVLVGHFTTEAKGQIRCVGITGKTYKKNVKITMGTSAFAPSIGIGDFVFLGGAAGIDLFNCNPDALLGTYLVADGHAAIIGGAGAFAAVKVAPPQVSLQVSLQLLHGLGFDLGIHRMKIEAL